MWKGVIIKESLNDKSVLGLVNIVKTREITLEKEEERGVLTFYYVEVRGETIDEFLIEVQSTIKNGFYVHICKEGKMIVIFQDKIFKFTLDEIDVLNGAREHGLSLGIMSEQMPFELLIKNPHK